MLKQLFLLMIFVFNCLSMQSQQIWYVKQGALGLNNGTNWQNAFQNLQSALQIAQKGDAIWVSAGTYLPTNTNNRNQRFKLPSGVSLYGGFIGTENVLDERVSTNAPSILSGNIGNPTDSTDNSYTILFMPFPDSTTLVDNIVFQGGQASSDTTFQALSPTLSGGAVYIEAKDSFALPTFSNCIFRNNYAKGSGGAIFLNGRQCKGCAPIFNYCQFINNTARSNGGAICWFGGYIRERGVDFNHCIFLKNKSFSSGGCIYFGQNKQHKSLEIKKCDVQESYTLSQGSFIYYNPDGAFDILFQVDSCIFKKNQVTHEGLITVNSLYEVNSVIYSIIGNIVTENIGVYLNSYVPFIQVDLSTYTNFENTIFFKENYFKGNKGITSMSQNCKNRYISGNKFLDENKFEDILCQSYGTTLNKTEIIGNIFFGGSISPRISFGHYDVDDYLKISNNLLIKNESIFDIFSIGIFPSINNNFFDLNISNNLFVQNNSNTEYLGDPFHNISHKVIVKNNIFYNNKDITTGQINIPIPKILDSIHFDNNIIDIPCDQIIGITDCGTNNIYLTYPMFIDTANGNYHLSPCSPGIDAGDSTVWTPAGLNTDYDGQSRILGTNVDIGPYEMPNIALSAVPALTAACEGIPAGTVTLQPSNACPPYTYTWKRGNMIGTGNTALIPGQYTISITDARNRSFSMPIEIPLLPPPILTPIVTPIVCGETLGGTATVGVSSAAYPYNYIWENNSSDSIRTHLSPGIYALTVTDANLCTNNALLQVTKNGNLNIDLLTDAIKCYNLNDGLIAATPINGLAPYSYIWSTGDTSSTLNMLSAGNFAGTITDGFGCKAFWIVPLEAPSQISYHVLIQNTSTQSSLDGFANIDTIRGGFAPYQVQWSNGYTGLNNTGLVAGVYYFTITDANECVNTDSIEIKTSISVIDKAIDNNLKIYPNPVVENQLFIEKNILEIDNFSLSIADITGKIVKNVVLENIPKQEINVENISKGAYFLIFKSKDFIISTKKIIIID
jgi:predicted outer membrane repeat protein